MERITDHVFAATDYQGCNPGYVVTSDGVVVIDSPMLPTRAVELREEILKKGPIRFLINTENHVDHNFGNHFFAGLCPTIGHDYMVEEFWAPVGGIDRYDFIREAVQKDDPEGMKLIPVKKDLIVKPPTITFRSRMTLRVGEHVFELIHTPGHTKGETSVYIPQEKVIFVGDNIFCECQTWFYTSDPDIWLKSLGFIKTLDFQHVVPGHGPICDRDYIGKQEAFIREWVKAVASGIAEGWTKEQCVENISLVDRFPMGPGLESVAAMVRRANIERIFDFIKGKVGKFRWELGSYNR
jgi:cyclase